VPWQRVIASSGQISRREPGGAERQQRALEAEGVHVAAGRTGELRVDLREYGWFPELREIEPPEEEDDAGEEAEADGSEVREGP
jgi:methylated-DNA-protein-cysteine methyltransferase-like protein